GYDFQDVFGHKTRENLFVSKLLETRKGNCHSLPYLYKILCEELGVDANLALAPNHVYIKHRNIKEGWYNTELTSGIFPIDAWIMASGFVHIDAISNGVYMKALNNRESIAVVMIDLADNYNVKFPNNDGTFIL
ncbi:transglutaminase family protein, partial [Flavobacterium psychrophilum]